MNDEFHGQCLCGQVKFKVAGFSKQVANCHCSMCQKFHGAGFGTLVAVEGLEWLQGRSLLKGYQADNGTTRTFCQNCGSSIGFQGKGAGESEIEIAIALFDGDLPVKVDAQIFTDFKSNWCELYSDIPVYQEGRCEN